MFQVVFKRINGRKFTKEQYLAWVNTQNEREAKFVLNEDRRARIMDAYRYRKHSHALKLVKPPTPRELEVGIPLCCNEEPVEPNQFTDDFWYCRTCRKSRLR